MTNPPNDGRRIARALALLAASILVSLAGSFAATGLAMSGYDLFWHVSVAGCAVGLTGALLLTRYHRAYRAAAATFVLSGLVTAAQQLFHDFGVLREAGELFWFAALAVTMLLCYGAMYNAVRGHLRASGAPEELATRGRRWVVWTLVALLLNLVSMAALQYLAITAAWYAFAQLCVVMVAFAFLVSALIVGVRYLLSARKFFLQQCGRKT